MIAYLLHQSPIWNDLPNGKRNVRIMVIALMIYIILKALAFENKDKLLGRIINDWFMYFFVVDFLACAALYKMYYGRNIFKELTPYEEDEYDEKSHKYKPKKKNTNYVYDENEPIPEMEDIIEQELQIAKEKDENKKDLSLV